MIRPESLAGVRAGFFTRQGGVSQGRFASLNCGLGSGDDPAKVETNRARAMNQLETDPAGLVSAYQVHGRAVATVTAPWSTGDRPKVDGLVTDRPGIALGILTADCTPVLLADREAGVIGACHAGWRGALDGITDATLSVMCSLGARRGHIAAAIGPTIAQASYEVGPEFEAAFLAASADNARWFAPGKRGDRRQFDLPGYVGARLKAAGVGTVENLRRDTCAEEEAFFSWRRTSLRGESDYGRNLSSIAL
ncbi:MAG: peptidoglycan editing factor PgeF [Alphaproteobacteria bacterium]|nr:peptidoglycan editing factor PgeF [Alphaproteobacteria bacterium]